MAVAMGAAACVPKDSDQALIWDAEKQVANQMKDPSSAKFSSEFVETTAPPYYTRGPISAGADREFTVCGWVNGKNSFGAMSGSARFVAHGRSTSETLDIYIVKIDDGDRHGLPHDAEHSETPFDKVYWNDYCVDPGHPEMYTGDP